MWVVIKIIANICPSKCCTCIYSCNLPFNLIKLELLSREAGLGLESKHQGQDLYSSVWARFSCSNKKLHRLNTKIAYFSLTLLALDGPARSSALHSHSRSWAAWGSTICCTVWNMQPPYCCSRKTERRMDFSMLQARNESCHFHSVLLFLWSGPTLYGALKFALSVPGTWLGLTVQSRRSTPRPDQDLRGPQPSFPLFGTPSDLLPHAWSQLDAPKEPWDLLLWECSGITCLALAPGGQPGKADCSCWPVWYFFCGLTQDWATRMVLTCSFWVTLTHVWHKMSFVFWATICLPPSLGLESCLGPYNSSHLFVFNSRHHLQSTAPKHGIRHPLLCVPPIADMQHSCHSFWKLSITWQRVLGGEWEWPISFKGKFLYHCYLDNGLFQLMSSLASNYCGDIKPYQMKDQTFLVWMGLLFSLCPWAPHLSPLLVSVQNSGMWWPLKEITFWWVQPKKFKRRHSWKMCCNPFTL